MITSTYITGIQVPAFDSLVSDALQYPLEGGGKDMRIAIEIPDGRVYRVVQTTGLGAFIHATQNLLGLGFTDSLETAAGSVGGFDARMVPGPALSTPVTAQDTQLAEDLENVSASSSTERLALVNARLGQGAFRADVIKHWLVCSVTGADCVPLLRASHIKPWRASTDEERLDPNNGLLLAPNLDAAFDLGYISFEDTGRILLSSRAARGPAYQLHIGPKMRLNAKLLTAAHRQYLGCHRQTVFLG